MGNMGMVPFAFAGVYASGALLRVMPIGVRAACFSAAGIVLAMRVAPEVREFHFVPHEDWSLAGRVVDAAFAGGTRVNYATYAKYLEHTIRDPKKRSSPFREQAFLEGSLIVADAGNKWTTGNRFFRPAGEPYDAQISIPGQMRDIVLTFRIPQSAPFLDAPGKITDRDSKTGIALADHPLRLQTGGSPGVQAFVFLFGSDVTPSALRFSARDLSDESDHSDKAIYAGNAIVFPLNAPSEMGHQFRFEMKASDPSISLREAWGVMPDAPAAHLKYK
jgi:hypothetical protein